MRMLLSTIRKNQWVLLDWASARTETRFYPLRKDELTAGLKGAPFDAPVVQVLELEGKPSSQTVDSDKIKLFGRMLVNWEPLWLPRKVLLDSTGAPVAIGIPRVPRRDMGEARGLRGRVGKSEKAYGEARLSEPPRPDTPLEYSIVRIFYATDRAKGVSGYTASRCGDEKLRFGTCDVTIPRDHRMAVLESPRWWKFEFKNNPNKYVTLQQVNELPEGDFFSKLRNCVSADLDRSVLVFIHGFCASFEDAARRTAQLSYDLGFKGAPVLYSWPSAGSLTGYLTDEASIEWTKLHLSKFLHDLANTTGALRIHVIAHSMGNRALVKILDSGVSGGQSLYNQVVLTAPDIDAGEFLQLASGIRSAAERITLYASSNDNAISLSKKMHTYPRAGESGDDIVVVTGMDTVDASSVDTSLTGHSYYAEKRHGLDRKSCPKGEYWAFRP